MKHMKQFTIFIVGLGLALSLAGQAGATVLTFTDKPTWEAALAGALFGTENFNGSASSFAANSAGNSIGTVTTLDVIGHAGDASRQGLTGTGFLEGELDSSGLDFARLQFNTPSIIGFAIVGLQNNNNTPSYQTTEFGILVEGEKFLASDVTGNTDSQTAIGEIDGVFGDVPFMGFITMNPVTSFRLVHGDEVAPFGVDGNEENWWIDELILAQRGNQPVPEPSTRLLLGSGLVGLIGYRLKKKA